ncbi:MAG TPA: DUF1674 domain-containing protein [Gammaproteobacteria bacterium]|jgi:hypothetical protein|nr:DUF1674 domain-containing protein [Gammaproteobacteria bacterium]
MDDSVKNESTVSGSPETEGKRDAAEPVEEHGGPKGPEPTRYGDWEKKGRCIDF